MTIELLTEKDYSVSNWSGGQTKQLFIFPPDTSYSDQTFDIRISSATIEVDESEFTALPEYDRILMILNGETELTHVEDRQKRIATLKPFMQDSFSGDIQTSSRGKCTDFNLMYRKGKYYGEVRVMINDAINIFEDNIYLIYAVQNTSVYDSNIDTHYDLKQGEALVFQNESTSVNIHYDNNDISALLCVLSPK